MRTEIPTWPTPSPGLPHSGMKERGFLVSIPGVPLLSDSEDGGLGGFRVFGFTCAMPALPCYTSLCRSQESHGS